MFEDKLVVVADTDGSIYKSKVLLMEEGIGVSIIKMNDPETYVFCLVGKNSPKFNGCVADGDDRKSMADLTDDVFNYVKTCIENSAVISIKKIDRMLEAWKPGLEVVDAAGSETCAFNA